MIFNRVKISAPCYGCEKRHLGCHSECIEYKDFQSELYKQREDIKSELETQAKCREIKAGGVRASVKRRNK